MHMTRQRCFHDAPYSAGRPLGLVALSSPKRSGHRCTCEALLLVVVVLFGGGGGKVGAFTGGRGEGGGENGRGCAMNSKWRTDAASGGE